MRLQIVTIGLKLYKYMGNHMDHRTEVLKEICLAFPVKFVYQLNVMIVTQLVLTLSTSTSF